MDAWDSREWYSFVVPLLAARVSPGSALTGTVGDGVIPLNCHKQIVVKERAQAKVAKAKQM